MDTNEMNANKMALNKIKQKYYSDYWKNTKNNKILKIKNKSMVFELAVKRNYFNYSSFVNRMRSKLSQISNMKWKINLANINPFMSHKWTNIGDDRICFMEGSVKIFVIKYVANDN